MSAPKAAPQRTFAKDGAPAPEQAIQPDPETHDDKIFRLMSEVTKKINELHQTSPLFTRILISNVYGAVHGQAVNWNHELVDPAVAAAPQNAVVPA